MSYLNHARERGQNGRFGHENYGGERAGSSQQDEMRGLEKLLARRDQLEKQINDGFRYGFQTIDQVHAG